jgi:hypothetical protein
VFVRNHVDFLRGALIDSAMVDDLASAVQGAKPAVQSGARDKALTMSRLALRYLFNTDGVQQWGPANILNLPMPDQAVDQNDPQQSFEPHAAINSGTMPSGLSVGDVLLGIFTGGASLVPQITADVYKSFRDNEQKIAASGGFDTAVRTKASSIFATLAYFNAIVHEDVPVDPNDSSKGTVSILKDDDSAILLAVALANDLQLQWDKLYPDPLHSDELHAMMSSRNYTEVFRRVPGFIAMIREIVRPLVEPAGADSQAIVAHNQDVFTLNRVVDHMANYKAYYTERFLHYLADTTSNQAIVDFATAGMANVVFTFDFDPTAFDLDRAFLVRREIIVPGLAPLDPAALSQVGKTLGGRVEAVALPVATVEDIETPCDGVHFEVAPGACLLANVPDDSNFPASLTGLTIGVP